ncbi:hypothetical protein Bhyg_14620 [Pseudolycoriella hygida]|uniref:Uncharacterized protein n=1 Tax=Pseudolycoriella hygida TaxID=35572 RepID=A0A9Q0MQB0_9DIPT|nr:hypothetical protein Bhyg_14620 [Pseudolycoriella hygida]
MEVDTTDTKTSNKIKETLLELGVGFRAKNDPFFNEVNKLENPIEKLGVHSDLLEEEGPNSETPAWFWKPRRRNYFKILY